MKLVILIGILLVSTFSVYTSRHFEKVAHNLKQRGLEKTKLADIRTICNDVILNQEPYRYNGTVKSGYLNVGAHKGASALAFIFYGKEGVSKMEIKNYPILIWLNGGPGSSSQLGNFMELGPFFIKESTEEAYKIERNIHAWTQQYNILFVDQPVGTGLSYADTRVPEAFVKSMDDVGEDFYNALYAMYNENAGCFKDLGITGDNDLFIFGESYAGKYVPAIAQRILSEKDKGGFLTGLRGAAIGDGFTHPYNILAEVGAFAYNVGLIDFQERSKIQQLIINATFQNRNRQWSDLHYTFDTVLDNIVDWAGGVNVYDFTSYKDYPTSLLEEYFWNPDIKKLFKLDDNIEYGSQGDKVYAGLFEDFMKPEVARVEYLLTKELPVLIYNGQNDIIVQTPGTNRWVEQIYYKDQQSFRDQNFQVWKVDGKMAGSMKKAGKLQYKIVNNAGHLVPMDQGHNSLSMVKDFVNANKK